MKKLVEPSFDQQRKSAEKMKNAATSGNKSLGYTFLKDRII